ncbi:MAG: hypothetical protein ABI570_08610 [Ilumatobacteraceae bacterium]
MVVSTVLANKTRAEPFSNNGFNVFAARLDSSGVTARTILARSIQI